MMKNLKCIACGSKVTAELQNLFDTRFGIEKVWNICRCTDCGIEQTIPLPCSGELKKLYEEYYNFGGEKGTIYTRFREYLLIAFKISRAIFWQHEEPEEFELHRLLTGRV